MPPVREASTKPSAATVLPAPVACSNQKRRAAPGSSATASAAASSSASSAGSQSSGSSSGSSSPSSSSSPECSSSEAALPFPLPLRPIKSSDSSAIRVPGQSVDLVRGERRAVGEVRLLLRQQPLQAHNQREVAPPVDGRLAAAAVDLAQRGVEGGAACAVLRKGGSGVLPIEDKWFAREFLGALQFFAGHRRGFGHGASFSHGKAVLGKGKDVPSCSFRSQRGTPVMRRRSHESRE